MTEIPSRASVAPQLVEILRRMLHDGEWTEMLPSERILCEKLQVSRPTLRKALATLTGEGLVVPVRGLGWRVGPIRPKPSRPRASRSVGILCFVPLDEASGFTLYAIDQLQDHLHEAGLIARVHAGGEYASQNYRKGLDRLVRSEPSAVWVLVGAGAMAIEWFREHHIPFCVTFTTEPSVAYPSLHLDLEEAYRQAVRVLVQAGHRRIALVLPRPTPVLHNRRGTEDPVCIWEKAVMEHRTSPGFTGRILWHNRTRDSVRRSLHDAFASAERPTALVVVRPQHALAALTWFTAAGVRVPEQVSLISMGYETFLDHVHPAIACFSLERKAFARKLCRLVVPWAKTGYWPQPERSLKMSFHPGESIAPPR